MNTKKLKDYENAIPLPYAVHHYFDYKHRSDKRERIWMDENGELQNLQRFFGGSDNDVRSFMMDKQRTRLPNGMMPSHWQCRLPQQVVLVLGQFIVYESKVETWQRRRPFLLQCFNSEIWHFA